MTCRNPIFPVRKSSSGLSADVDWPACSRIRSEDVSVPSYLIACSEWSHKDSVNQQPLQSRKSCVTSHLRSSSHFLLYGTKRYELYKCCGGMRWAWCELMYDANTVPCTGNSSGQISVILSLNIIRNHYYLVFVQIRWAFKTHMYTCVLVVIMW